MKKQLPGWAVLLIITLAAGLALGGTNALTKDPIAQQALIKAENARKAALPDAETFEELPLSEGAAVDWVYAGLKDGSPVGYVAQKTVNGFGGKVEVIAGVDAKAAPETFSIGGITVGGSDFSETAGLGARAKEPAFTNQFVGKIYPVSYIKAGGEATESTVDALTSATITTTAVVNGVNDIVKYVKADVMGIVGVEMPAKPADGVFSASEKGFRGPVYVEATFDGAGKVTYIKVGDESFAEDIGVGVIEPDFMIQFIGKQMPLEVGDIDVIASATISSTAVVKALNTAYAVAGGAEIVEPETPAMPEKPAEGVFSASEKGFAGPVYVEAAFDEEGKITYLAVGDDQFAETEGFGARALEAEEQYPFIGAQMPLELGSVDTLTGATFTKTAIVNGLNKAYAVSKGEAIEEPVVEEIVMPEKPAEGVFSASEKGFAGPVYVEAAFDEDGKITYLAVGDDQFAETEGFGARALEAEEQYPFIGTQMPLELGSIDALTGATFTKTAIVNGLNKAYAAFKGDVAEEPSVEEAPAETKAVAENAVIASAQGFGGPVAVEATFDADGKITYIKIGDDSFAETPGLGARALEDEFQAQFIGKQMPLALADIDAIAGATVTSTAVVDALNEAYASTNTAAEPVEAASENTVIASAQGFGGPVAVEAAFDADGKITSIKIGDDSFAETPGLGARALEDEFQAQFIGKQMPLTLADIDAIAGATVTSTAVVDALNEAYASTGAAVEPVEAPVSEPNEEPVAEAVSEALPEADEEPELPVAELLLVKNYGAVSEITLDSKDVQVRVTKANGVIAGLAVLEKPEGSDQSAYTVSSLDEEMKNLFLAKTLPVDVNGQSSEEAAAVANAINAACGFETQAITVKEEAPLKEKQNEPETQAQPEAKPEAAEEKPETASSTLTLRVTVEAENDVLTALTVLEKAADSEEYIPCAQEDALKEKFIGMALPLETTQSSMLESVAAIAINKAYYDQMREAEDKIIGGADSPTGILPAENDNDEPAYFGEAIIFFTSIRAKVTITPALTVEAVSFEEKQVGADSYQPSERNDELEALFVGEALPLDVSAYDNLYETAAAIAVNEAFAKMPDLSSEMIVFSSFGIGESVSFFTVYTTAAAFEGDKLVTFGAYKAPVGNSAATEGVSCEALNEKLDGLQMPLSVGEYMIADMPEYEVIAIEIALNQAYENSLAGLQ